MTLKTISASKIKTYRTCARQYYYKYVLPRKDRPTEDKNIGALLGSSLHEAIEQYYKHSADPVQTFRAMMHSELETWESKGYTIKGEEWFSKSLKDGTAIMRGFDWDAFDPIVIEHEFTLPFPNSTAPVVLINGFIDMITKDMRVIDHKSQRDKLTEDQLANDSQFIIYAWAYREMFGILPEQVIWNHLRTNELITADVLTDFDFKLNNLQQDISALLENTGYQRRQMDTVCVKECSFYKECYGLMAKQR